MIRRVGSGARRGLGCLALAVATACVHKPPRAVADLPGAMVGARAVCVEAYAPERTAAAVEAIARAEEAGRSWHRIRARRLARAAQDAIRAAIEEAEKRQALALATAESAIERADLVVGRAGAEAESSPQPGDEWLRELNSARTLLDEARRLVDFHPCEYPRAEAIAGEAEVAAARAMLSARQAREELAREEQERRTAEAAHRRDAARRRAAEAEARRRAEIVEIARPVNRWGVAEGDCLWRIAADPRVYGDPFLWPLLYHANSLQIADPDLILPGQSFLVPRASSPAEVVGAIREAKDRVWPTTNYLFDGK